MKTLKQIRLTELVTRIKDKTAISAVVFNKTVYHGKGLDHSDFVPVLVSHLSKITPKEKLESWDDWDKPFQKVFDKFYEKHVDDLGYWSPTLDQFEPYSNDAISTKGFKRVDVTTLPKWKHFPNNRIARKDAELLAKRHPFGPGAPVKGIGL